MPTAGPAHNGHVHEEIAATMTIDTLTAAAPSSDHGTPDVVVPSVERAQSKRAAAKRTKTLELSLTVTGTADGEWVAELRHGSTYLARNLAVAAAAVSRAAKELHDDLGTPIDAVIEEARSQQASRVAALEAELEAARRALAELD